MRKHFQHNLISTQKETKKMEKKLSKLNQKKVHKVVDIC